MKPAGWFFLGVIAFGLGGLYFATRPAPVTRAQESQPTIINTQSPATTATPDAAQIARVTLAAGDVTMQAIELEAARLSIQMTAQAGDLSNSITATAASIQADNQRAAATIAAQAQRLAATRTAQSDGATATAIFARVNEMAMESQARQAAIPWAVAWDIVRPVIGYILAVGIGLVVALKLARWVASVWPVPVVELGDLPTEETYASGEPAQTPMVVNVKRGNTLALLDDCPIDAESMAEFATGVLAGRPVTFQEWTAPGWFTRTQYADLVAWMLKRNLLRQKNNEPRSGVVLTDDGIAVMRALSPSPTAANGNNQPVQRTQNSTAQAGTENTEE